MAVIEQQAHGIVADRFRARDRDTPLAADGLALRQSAARLLGFLRGLHAAGVPVRRENVLSSSGYSAERAHGVVLERFGTNPPTALFATDYVMTTAAYRALLELRLHVPAEVSFVGFDDLEWTSLITPPLTVVSQPVRRMGQLAAERLLARVAGDNSPATRITPETQLLLRRSTTTPRPATSHAN